MDLAVFPIPNSGRIDIVPKGLTEFDVELSDLDSTDNGKMTAFFCQMQGRAGAFRFEHAGVIYSKCRFDSDRVDFISHGPNRYSVTFPIKILPDQG